MPSAEPVAKMPSAIQAANITVDVSGNVNKPGKYDLSPPFTVYHAVKQAGGILESEDWRQEVQVYHLDGQRTVMHNQDDESFILVDGDRLVVRRLLRHY